MLAACNGQELPTSAGSESAGSSKTTVSRSASPPTPPTVSTSAASTAPPDAAILRKSAYFKDPAPFIQRGSGLEARLENMQGVITPTESFFVRNNSESLEIDADAWRLSIEGDSVSEPLQLSYSDILGMPSTTLTAYLECAGNHRAMFGLLNGREAQGTQWERGAVGNAEWTGVQLGLILERAGVDFSRARSVLLIGLDEGSPEAGFRRAMPTDKALDPHTLLAYRINGETLPADHGFPLRAVVPGWSAVLGSSG